MLLYRHLKPCGEVFYIGVGNKIRPYTKSDRSDFWWKVVKKYGYEIQILKTDLTKEDAYELEIILIDWYGRKNLGLGTLVNLTNGGDGSNSVIISEETRQKLRNARKNYIQPESVKLKISNSHKGKKLSEETKLKISNSHKGKFLSNTHILNMKIAQKGEKNGMFGKKQSLETRNKIREKAIGRKLSYISRLKFSKKVINFRTNQIYNSVQEACDDFNFSYRFLIKRLNGETKNFTVLSYFKELPLPDNKPAMKEVYNFLKIIK